MARLPFEKWNKKKQKQAIGHLVERQGRDSCRSVSSGDSSIWLLLLLFGVVFFLVFGTFFVRRSLRRSHRSAAGSRFYFRASGVTFGRWIPLRWWQNWFIFGFLSTLLDRFWILSQLSEKFHHRSFGFVFTYNQLDVIGVSHPWRVFFQIALRF